MSPRRKRQRSGRQIEHYGIQGSKGQQVPPDRLESDPRNRTLSLSEKMHGRARFINDDDDDAQLEYDTDRSGSLEPLKYLPLNKTVVLGFITTKSGKVRVKARYALLR